MGWPRLVIQAACLAAACGGCTASTSNSDDFYAQVPIVYANEANPVENITELLAASDLVVIGEVVNVAVVELDTRTPAAGASDLVLEGARVELTVAPRGGGESVVVGMWAEASPEEIARIRATLGALGRPSGLAVFALVGPTDDWGYSCTSADAALCPLEIRGESWHSPRAPERDAGLASDEVQPGENFAALVIAFARQYGFDVRGA